jgi:phosphomannomutase
MSFFADTKLTKLLDWPITRREDLDGLKMYLCDIGWVMVRASGTENMLRVYAETTRAETTRRVLDEVTAQVKDLH